MKILSISLLAVSTLMLSSCGAAESKSNTMLLFDENGQITEEHSELMKQSWCEYNEGRDFVKDQCK